MKKLENRNNMFEVVKFREIKKEDYFKPALVVLLFTVGILMFSFNFHSGLGCGVMLLSVIMAKTFHKQEVLNGN
ncbi:MAG: hypothetical protein K2W92_02630 [Alphaproteobacteria bacterium]|nr:hypothetical protein [Alphaproteobacteria bacterium]